MCKKLVCLALVLGLASAAYADFTISDWEDQTLQGWTNGHNMPGGYKSGYPMWATDGLPTASGVLTGGNITPAGTPDCQSPQGGTPGNLYSMTVQVPETWWDEAAIIDLTQVEGGVDAFFDNDTLRVVVSLSAAAWGIDAGAWCRPGLTLAICAETSDHKWDIDSVGAPGRGWWGSDDMPTWKTSSWLPNWGDYSITFSFYYGDIITKGGCQAKDYLLDVRDKIDKTPSALGLILIPHWGETFSGTAVGGVYEFDEATLVPEPATMALLGLGGLALIRRKR
jgi:hypothetical protein